MYHSKFYDMLYRLNTVPRWRTLLNSPEPDLHTKDIEILLRGFAMLVEGDNYKPSLLRFLNAFSKKCERNSEDQNRYLEQLFLSFLRSTTGVPPAVFVNEKNNRFNIALFEAVFTAACGKAFAERREVEGALSAAQVASLASDNEFVKAALEGTTRTANVETRLRRARVLISPL